MMGNKNLVYDGYNKKKEKREKYKSQHSFNFLKAVIMLKRSTAFALYFTQSAGSCCF